MANPNDASKWKLCHVQLVTGTEEEAAEQANKVPLVEATPIHQVAMNLAGVNLVYQMYKGKTATLTILMDPVVTNGHLIQIGDVEAVNQSRSVIEKVFLDHLDEILAPNGIVHMLSHVPPMTIVVDPTDSTPLPRVKVTRWSATEEKVLKEYDDKMAAAGKLEPSPSPTSMRPILVAKKDGMWRIVFNFSPIGRRIVPMAWPLEPCDKVLQRMVCWTFISMFDHSLGYHQCPMDETCRWLTAIVFPRGLRQYTVAPMGWKDSVEWMAKHMAIMYDDAAIIGDNKLHDHMSLSCDDGSIGTNSIDEHIYYMNRMLDCVKCHMGSLSDKKSVWFVQRAVVHYRRKSLLPRRDMQEILSGNYG
ncbi:hypothetical protein SpCBS45565_g08499 [Spizellomyces sp. 'palustris']|nr:hypothetical protein SpCBS45565_g08499 [Spizellomyces sp. 'palustris']